MLSLETPQVSSQVACLLGFIIIISRLLRLLLNLLQLLRLAGADEQQQNQHSIDCHYTSSLQRETGNQKHSDSCLETRNSTVDR